MNISRSFCVLVAGIGVVATSQAQLTQVNLVSDGFIPAAVTDPNLVNAWGIDFSPTSPLWVNSAGMDKSLVYQNDGTIAPLVVSVPPAGSEPTGIVFNGGTGFVVSKGEVSAPARFIFVTVQGTISGWAPSVDSANAVLMADRSAFGANYTGVTIGSWRGAEYLFAANFRTGYIDVFDHQWNYVTSFTNFRLPRNYAPFNVKAYGNFLIVAWAQVDPTGSDEVKGPGNGYIEIFTTGGRFVSRLVSRGALNAPWGLALNIDRKGRPLTKLYVGNFGDGRINRYDLFTGADLGPVRGVDHKPIEIDGLWGIAFRNVTDPTTSKPVQTLFFAAGPEDETRGLLGKLIPTPSG